MKNGEKSRSGRSYSHQYPDGKQRRKNLASRPGKRELALIESNGIWRPKED